MKTANKKPQSFQGSGPNVASSDARISHLLHQFKQFFKAVSPNACNSLRSQRFARLLHEEIFKRFPTIESWPVTFLDEEHDGRHFRKIRVSNAPVGNLETTQYRTKTLAVRTSDSLEWKAVDDFEDVRMIVTDALWEWIEWANGPFVRDACPSRAQAVGEDSDASDGIGLTSVAEQAFESDPTELSELKKNLLQALLELGPGVYSAQSIAEKAGYSYSSSLRESISQLRNARWLTGEPGERGYAIVKERRDDVSRLIS